MAVLVCADTCLDAFVAARATVEVDQHQLLALDQAKVGELVRELDLIGFFPHGDERAWRSSVCGDWRSPP